VARLAAIVHLVERSVPRAASYRAPGLRIEEGMTTTTHPLHSTQHHPSKALTVALWIFQVGLAAMFVMAGGNKLAGNAMMVGLFDAIGIGQWFRYVTGTLEVVGAVALLVPRAAGLGASLLIPVMVGAIVTHFVVLHSSPAMPVVLLLGLGFVAWGRREQLESVVARLRG
jgi:uncharacterized membrane protein YphA (DoxX/SURF4 family)